jgi:Spy/CpxP family protein refolding chaperone
MKHFPSSSPRRSRAFGLALGCVLAGGIALAAWAASDEAGGRRPPPPPPGLALPRGPMLDHLLDEAQASPTQRAQVRQIFEAADADLTAGRPAERADREQMMQLFSQPVVDASQVEAVRQRVAVRRDAESRRVLQAMVDASQVLSVDQRRVVLRAVAAGPHPDGRRGRGASDASASDAR